MPTLRPKAGPFRNVLLVVGSIICALLLAEGLLALLQPKQLRVNHRDFYEYDQLLGWKKKANARRVNVTEEFRAVEVTNSKGIRGGEYSYRKRPNEYRLMVLGDSFTEGYTVKFEDLFSEVLRNKLSQGSDSTYYEVINTATVGYGTDQELLFYRHEGYKYRPDFVTVMFYENDVMDNVTRREIYGKYKPLFRIDDDKLVLTKSPGPGELPEEQPEIAVEDRDGNHWLKNHSRVYSLVITGLAKWGLTADEAAIKPLIPRDFRVLSREPDSEVVQAWKITEMLLVELKKSVQENGGNLLVFYVPSIHSIDPDLWEATKKKYGMTGDEWDANRVESNLIRICNEHSIDCMPSIAQFKERVRSLGKDASWFYHPRDAHWNARGHRLVGEMLADRIRSGFQRPRLSVPSSGSRRRADRVDQRE